jgi:hypothetical protein
MKKMLLTLGVVFCMTLTIDAQTANPDCGPNASYAVSSCKSGCYSVYSNSGTSADFSPLKPSESQLGDIEARLEKQCNLGNAPGTNPPSLGDL